MEVTSAVSHLINRCMLLILNVHSSYYCWNVTVLWLKSFFVTCQVMEETSDVAVLIPHSSAATSSSSSSAPFVLSSHAQSQIPQAVVVDTSQRFQQKQAADSLIQVIEKLSKIVEKRPQRHCTLLGQKRVLQQASPPAAGCEEGVRRSRGGSLFKKLKRDCKDEDGEDGPGVEGALAASVLGDSNNNITSTVTDRTNLDTGGDQKRTVTCYQCSLCPYLSPALALLKEHLKQHNEQHSDLILMCSECRFSSRDQDQLEEHVRLHFDSRDNLNRESWELLGEVKEERDLQDADWTVSSSPPGTEGIISSAVESQECHQKKKWYSYEEYGLYRCLICSYVCTQQRMLKTHAWKHAGLVDCSYPIFEDDDGAPTRSDLPAAHTAATREDIVVLSPVVQEENLQKFPAALKLQLRVPLPAKNQHERESTHLEEEVDDSVYSDKDLTSEEPLVEVQVTTEAVETDSHGEGPSATDSLLSSAQKIINSSPNSAGHVNVIVERLPSADDSVIASNPLLLGPDVDQNLPDCEEEEERDKVGAVCYKEEPEEVDLGLTADVPDMTPSIVSSSDSQRDENVPPAGRKRTHSESLRLHSLAAEALVAMPMRTPEPSSARLSVKTTNSPTPSPDACQKLVGTSHTGQTASEAETTAALLDLELGEGREAGLGFLGLGEEDEDGPTTKAGISLSLLTVIERLRERSDQNISDEDILKELQDNAQFQTGAVAGVVAAHADGSYVCSVPGVEGFVASPDGRLVDYVPGSERPYRCRLCHYSSGNKGYIKQHLRVHRQRQPYQCPICEHIAMDSKDLESHMIHHCKTRTYQCRQCPEAFHYKVR